MDTIHVINHDTEETFQIVGFENFIEWLNDNDAVFSYSLDINDVVKHLEGK